MKTLLSYLLFGVCIITSTNLSSIKRVKSTNNIEIKSYKIEDLNICKINQELDSLNKKCKTCNSGFYYGKEVDTKIDFFKSAQNIGVIENEKVWLLKIESKNAKGYQLIFNNFQLQKGEKIFIYNEEKNMILGSFTSENNRKDSTFLTQNINGKNIYIEYIAPSKMVESKIFIDKIVYIFDNCFTANKGPFSSEASAACNINTACPEAAGLDVEIKSTVMILEETNNNYWGICTGALINDGTNYIADNYPYLLTSNHCYEEIKDGVTTYADVSRWLFLFRHEATTCKNDGSEVSNNTTKSVLGAKIKLRDEQSKGADYLLLELNQRPSQIAQFDIAFAGYDYNYNEPIRVPGSLGFRAVGIHHPKGDVKKVLISEEKAESVGWNKTGDDHWKVISTKGFKTEPGSSGSPLFNNQHQIIGMCHGGSNDVTCDSDRKLFATLYGKLSDAYKNNNIYTYLYGSTADPYIPTVQNSSSFSISGYGSADVGVNLSVNCNMICNSISGGESVIIRLYINKTPYDYTSYNYLPDASNPDYYFYSAADVTIKDPYASSQLQRDYKFILPAFSEIGDYKAKIIITRRSESHANIYTKDFKITITPNATCNCGNIDFVFSSPQEKYAPGSKIAISESVQLPNTPVADINNISWSKDCYSKYNWDGCTNPNWMPKYVGVAKRTWSLNNGIISVDNFNTAIEYSATNPGKYYTPSIKYVELSEPGIYIYTVLFDLAFRYETQISYMLDCYGPRPNTYFEPSSDYSVNALGKSKKIIVADCNGHKVVDNAYDPLILNKLSNEKEIGVGTIEIQNVELKNNIYSVEAYKSIVFKPGTIIRGAGTIFDAKIIPCPEMVFTSQSSHAPFLKQYEANDLVPNLNELQYNSSPIIIYPNPTSGIVNIEVPQDVKILNIKIYEMNGQLLKEIPNIANPTVLDLSNLNERFYILKILSSNGVSNHKIILNKEKL